MITVAQYFQAKPHTPEQAALAEELLERVNALMDEAVTESTFKRVNCPNTGTEISGSKGGSGDGGFRLETATTGAGKSSHKEARAVDVYDPGNKLDAWVDDVILESYGLYREHPDETPGWCHLTTRPPASGRRTFHP